MHRFFSLLRLTETLRLTEGKHFHQISHVFRAKKGDQFAFFESGTPDTVYELIEIKKKEVVLHKIETKESKKNATNITLFRAYPNKISTMEFITQKLVEIGAEKIVFFGSSRSQIRAIPTQKKERIESIAIEALEQSGNNKCPDIIYSEKSLTELLEEYSEFNNFVGSPSGGIAMTKNTGKYGLWIGPEGGWTDEELLHFEKNKCVLWSFSKSILRLETASIVGAGILTYLIGE